MVLAFVEHDDGTPTETSLEQLSFARDLAAASDTSLEVVVFGAGGDGVADALGDQGVTAIHTVTHDDLDAYAPAAWGESIAQLASALSPAVVVGPGSERGQEVLAHVGAKLDAPMAANCLSADPGDPYEVTRQRWGGSLVEHAVIEGDPIILTATAHEHSIEAAADPTDPTVEAFTPDLAPGDLRVRVDRVEESDVEGVPLGEARVVVGGGRGVGSSEDFDKLEDLADVLGGTVGSSRAAVNEGWRPHDDQVGLTGAKISPDIYIACGISGAVQHMVGCKGADTILAINTDAEAAIMQNGDYAVEGDLHEIVPALTEAIRDRE